MEIKRGDIYYADLRPVIGSEQGGVRPVLIIQNNRGNQYSPTVIAAAITGRKKRWMPTHVRLYRQAGLNRNSCIMLEQVRTPVPAKWHRHDYHPAGKDTHLSKADQRRAGGADSEGHSMHREAV